LQIYGTTQIKETSGEFATYMLTLQ